MTNRWRITSLKCQIQTNNTEIPLKIGFRGNSISTVFFIRQSDSEDNSGHIRIGRIQTPIRDHVFENWFRFVSLWPTGFQATLSSDSDPHCSTTYYSSVAEAKIDFLTNCNQSVDLTLMSAHLSRSVIAQTRREREQELYSPKTMGNDTHKQRVL